MNELTPGQRVTHDDYGAGVVVNLPQGGFVRVFFSGGEREVPLSSTRLEASRAERIIGGVDSGDQRLRRAWLAYEAVALPMMESAAALTAAKIDLLPHQVVLTHQIATAAPRRFLVADEVGLGKTVETALLLRELASRSELQRALMIVPAGLVNNWHRELCEVFNLNFEVFGSEGDVTDRKSNAFAKHNRLIASVDTLKRPQRIRRLLDAPPWDLIVFDEAHHLTAYRSGGRVRKTENYKLAEALRTHARDMILLSATPHQGDHFRFWMLIQLLSPTLFTSADDMVENRHRLNAVVFRRTKADACRSDGTPLFARRWVHTESFLMSEDERRFYDELRGYLEDGFALARRQGNQGRGLGFVMAIFQKIAASSFAAVRRTLRRRLIMLTLAEAVLKDRDLDIDGRERLFDDARRLIREEYDLSDDEIGRSETDRVLADLKLRLVKQMDKDELELASDQYATEYASTNAEELAATAVKLALPEERSRIEAVLRSCPAHAETKVEKLLHALGALWREDPSEKVVVFATYLGTVDLLGKAIEKAFPGKGVVVLRGGDHGAKVAAEKRFRLKDGPKVLVCTAAGREGINLQFARILFNFDLPWNPMDVEQRIGRIHRYGQRHTAQVYNLVLSDTIEGKIFLLLDEKLQQIAKALGKIDEHGNVAEDLRSQILGQLSERLSYDRLYQEALGDHELRRTRLELDAALLNASEARRVVFELFQDLDGFKLDDYKPFADVDVGVGRLVRFLRCAVEDAGGRVSSMDTAIDVTAPGELARRLTTRRDEARADPDAELLGLDHPIVEAWIRRSRLRPPEELGVAVDAPGAEDGVVSFWLVRAQMERSERAHLQVLAVGLDGTRRPALEHRADEFWQGRSVAPRLTHVRRSELLSAHLEPMLRRELVHRGVTSERGSFSAELIGWLELVTPDAPN